MPELTLVFWRRILALPLRRGAIAIAVLGALAASAAPAADSGALWHVVHDLCVTDMKASGAPAPCTKVDLAGGFAVLKDIRGDTQLLLIPTDRVTGIEDPKVLAPGSPNYWQAAWESKALFEQRAGRPVRRQDLGFAINSVYGRSQNQLHIHIDCLRPDVQSALEANQSRIGRRWSVLPVALAGRHYRAMRIEGADLGDRDPFKLLADGDPQARADMGSETMVLVGLVLRDGRPGFVLLSDHASLAGRDSGHGEDLLDHQCAVLANPG